MNLYYKIIPLIITFVMYAPMTGWAGANPNAPYCEHDPACWEPNDDPSTWYGADCCRPKEDGTEAEVDGVAGRCCGGVWYAKDPAKENSDCWEWNDSTCEYVCSDVPDPEIAAEEVETVELECPWSTGPLPFLSATAKDHCGNTVAVEQSPEGGGEHMGMENLRLLL